MKLNISKACALLALGFIIFTACDPIAEGALFEGEGALVAFPSTQQVSELTSEDNGVLQVALYRGNSTGTLEVALELTADSVTLAQFTLATPTVSFENGETVAYAELSFDNNALAVTPYTMTLSVVDATLLSPSAQGEITIKASRKLTYESIGTGMFTSTIFGSSWEQEVLKAQEANVYLIEDCYYAGYDLLFVLSEDGTELVTFDNQETGYVHSDYGMASIYGEAMTRTGNTLDFTVNFNVSAGSFGSYVESLQLP